KKKPSSLGLVARLADDESPRVRFQAAFTLGQFFGTEAAAALAKILRRDADDPWTQTAVLSSASRHAPALLESLAQDKEFIGHLTPARSQALTRLAVMIGARGDEGEVARVLKLLANDRPGAAGWQATLLEGLGQGQQ